MSDLIEQEAVIAVVMQYASSDEKCQQDGGCRHPRCLQARQSSAEIRALPASTRDTKRDERVWVAALTLANNIAVQDSDRYNGNDETEAASACADTARRIRGWIDMAADERDALVDECGHEPSNLNLGERPAPRDTEKIVEAAKAMRAVFPDCLCIGDCPCQQAARAFDAAIAEGGKR